MSASWRAALGLLLLAGCAPPAPEAPAARDWAAAAAEYERLLRDDPESALLRYDLGSALVLARRYPESREHLERAAGAADAVLRERALYDLGNSYLEPVFAGRAAQGREEALRRAIDAYKKALLLAPSDADAKWNLELARGLLQRPPTGRGGGGGGGDGGGGSAARSENPRPQPAGGEGGDEEMSQGDAERILSAAQQRELGVQRDKLRRPQPPNPSAH